MICFQTLVSVLVRNIWTNTYHYLYNHIGQSLADLFRYFRIEDINWLFYSLISAQIKITYGAKHVYYSRKHRSTLLNVHQLGWELNTWSNSVILISIWFLEHWGSKKNLQKCFILCCKQEMKFWPPWAQVVLYFYDAVNTMFMYSIYLDEI